MNTEKSEAEQGCSGAGAETEAGEEGVTMLDVLEEEEALDDDCAAVLGGFSDSSCTYSLGCLPRQPLYACRDCSQGDSRAGVCLGCSYQCHEVSNTHKYSIKSTSWAVKANGSWVLPLLDLDQTLGSFACSWLYLHVNIGETLAKNIFALFSPLRLSERENPAIQIVYFDLRGKIPTGRKKAST